MIQFAELYVLNLKNIKECTLKRTSQSSWFFLWIWMKTNVIREGCRVKETKQCSWTSLRRWTRKWTKRLKQDERRGGQQGGQQGGQEWVVWIGTCISLKETEIKLEKRI